MGKFIAVVCLLLAVSYASAQVTLGIGGGIHNKSVLAASIEAGYQLKTYQASVGYVVPFSNHITDINVFFVKAGKGFKINKKTNIVAGTGLGIHNFSRKEVSKVDDRYSYNKQINAGKLLLYMNYEKKVIKDGSFVAQAFYSGGILYGGIGVKYFFKKKK